MRYNEFAQIPQVLDALKDRFASQGAVKVRAEAMLEEDLYRTVTEMATTYRWRWYHTHDSRKSNVGFPDLVLVREHRLLVVELKRQKGRWRPGQQEWLADVARVPGVEAYLWRPMDLFSGEIQRVLEPGPGMPVLRNATVVQR